MKLLVVSHSCITDVNQQLYVSMRRQSDFELELVIPAYWKTVYSPELQKPTLLPEIDFPVHALPVSSPGQLSLYTFRSGLGAVFQRFKPDLVYVDEEPWSLAMAQLMLLCARTHTPIVGHTLQNIRKNYPPPFGWIESWTYRQSAAIIALTEEVHDVLRAKGYRGTCPIVPLACDLSLFAPGINEEKRKELGLSGVVAGYMGRLVPEKGLQTLMDAASKLKQRRPDSPLQLLLIGSGPAEESLREQARKLGIQDVVRFTGPVPHRQAGEMLRCLDIFVLASLTTPRWKEQFGRVIVESMACRVPVIGSDSGQIPILIRETGGGLIFHEGDAEDLSRQLEELTFQSEKRLDLGKKGSLSVQERYTYDAVACEMIRLLTEYSMKSRGSKIAATRT